MSIEVMRPGLLTSIQDLGRFGWRRMGVVVGGAMDSLALTVANLLVENEPGAAGLELTLLGPSLRFESDLKIAICGGDLNPQVGGAIVPAWRPVRIPAGSELQFGQAASGCRAYLALAGGLDVPVALGSRSTHLRAGFGGLDGRSLRVGDRLSVRKADPPQFLSKGQVFATTWWAGATLANYSDQPTIRVTAGRQMQAFSDEARRHFFSGEFTVSANSDRMGYRLKGPLLSYAAAGELLSEGVTMGTIQVPPDGNPVVLMADGPVTGGYPKIAQVALVDLPVLAQLRPGATVRFQPITVAEAHALYCQRAAALAKLRQAIALQKPNRLRRMKGYDE